MIDTFETGLEEHVGRWWQMVKVDSWANIKLLLLLLKLKGNKTKIRGCKVSPGRTPDPCRILYRVYNYVTLSDTNALWRGHDHINDGLSYEMQSECSMCQLYKTWNDYYNVRTLNKDNIHGFRMYVFFFFCCSEQQNHE